MQGVIERKNGIRKYKKRDIVLADRCIYEFFTDNKNGKFAHRKYNLYGSKVSKDGKTIKIEFLSGEPSLSLKCDENIDEWYEKLYGNCLIAEEFVFFI